MKILRFLVALLVMVFVSFTGVFADGSEETEVEYEEVCTTSYGGVKTCEKREIPKETIVHDVTEVETGVVENVMLAVGLFVAGYLVLVLAKRWEVIK